SHPRPTSTMAPQEASATADPVPASNIPARSGFRTRTYGPATTNAGAGPRRGRPRPASRNALRPASATPRTITAKPTKRIQIGEALRPSPPSGKARRGPHSPLATLGRARSARKPTLTRTSLLRGSRGLAGHTEDLGPLRRRHGHDGEPG